MKKKIIIANLILFILLLAGSEMYSYKAIMDSFHPLHPNTEKLTYSIPHPYNYNDKKDEFSIFLPGQYSGKKEGAYKRPIALFGCSYVVGGGILEKDTLGANLNKDTNRIIFGRGRSNTSTDFMYRQLIDDNVKQEIPDVEYIIYVYLRYHGPRNVRYTSTLFSSPDIRYKVTKDGQLKEMRPFFTLPFYSLFTVKNIQDIIAGKKVEEETKKGEPLLLNFLASAYEAAQRNWPGVKFILLEYPDGTYCLSEENQYEENINDSNLPEDVIERIKDIGIIYVNAEELVGHELRDPKKYRHTDIEHPNGRAWKEVADALTKRFDM